MAAALANFMPEIVEMPEDKVIGMFKEHVGISVWAISDLEEWLQEFDLSDYEAFNYAEHLIDSMLDADLGYEYGGITPWCGEGYSLY